MPLQFRPEPYVIPAYSLTGDLLSYRKCGLQYRYHNRGSLPPSRPVQLWFGEFIHGVMEESFREWQQSVAVRGPLQNFPWTDAAIFDIEKEIAKRLEAQNLYPPPNLWDRTGVDARVATRRARASLNTWAPHLFPLIQEAEWLLQGIRAMPIPPGARRADYYEVRGIVDVLSSVTLSTASLSNKILQALQRDPHVAAQIKALGMAPFEIIVDYKGTRRPSQLVNDPRSPIFKQPSPDWVGYVNQILTYAWLRSQQKNAKPVIAGVLLYLNELEPSDEDLLELQVDTQIGTTDVLPQGADRSNLLGWTTGKPISLSKNFLEARCVHVVAINQTDINRSLSNFDADVKDIETHVIGEMKGQGIIGNWTARPERRTCTACDFKTYCPSSAQPGPPTAP